MTTPTIRANAKSFIDSLAKADKFSEEDSHLVAEVFVAWMGKVSYFKPADVALCTSAMMSTLRMVPLQDTIYRDGRNRLMIRGREVKDVEAEKKIIAAANKLRNNLVWKLVTEKVEFEAEVLHRKAFRFEDILFANAALFFSQQLNKVLTDLVGEDVEYETEELD